MPPKVLQPKAVPYMEQKLRLSWVDNSTKFLLSLLGESQGYVKYEMEICNDAIIPDLLDCSEA